MNVLKLLMIALFLLTGCSSTMKPSVFKAKTKAPAIVRMVASGPMPLYEGQTMRDLHAVAEHNGINLKQCLISQDAGIKYLDATGQ